MYWWKASHSETCSAARLPPQAIRPAAHLGVTSPNNPTKSPMTREYHQLEIPWFGGVVRFKRVVERDDAKPPSKPITVHGETIPNGPALVRAAVSRLVTVRKSA